MTPNFCSRSDTRSVTECKDLIMMSSGIDTFSKATYQDAVNTAAESDSSI
jgi:hypothetical protein